MRLYFELMGKYSNSILTENGVILGALKTTSIGENTKRVLFGGAKYCPPEPQQKANPQNKDELERVFSTPHGDMAKFICENVKGIAYSTAVDIVETYGENLTGSDVYNYVNESDISPCVILNGGEMSDFAVRFCGTNKISFSTILEAQSAFYDYTTTKKTFLLKKGRLENALSAQIKKIEKKLAIQRDKLAECDGADDIKLRGELITANIYAIERGMSSYVAVNYYDPECGKIKIELDKTLTPSQNAQRYYKKYAKLKRTYESVTAQRVETEAQLDYFKSIGAHIYAAEELCDLEEIEEELESLGLFKWENKNTKKKVLPAFRTFEIDGFKVIAGRNNIQNERLTKGLSGEDLWLHTQKYHSSHVGIITGGKNVPQNVLLAAAEICAHYSDGREGSKIPVDYTYKKFVKKPPKSAAGFVIYTDYNTILVDPNPHSELILKVEK
jgi:predicted ribosome quality control (RQC) complex YloA/Tae2 family protein